MTKKKEAAEKRRSEILHAALTVAGQKGYQAFTKADVAEYANCSTSLVGHYFSTMTKLRRAVMRSAIHNRVNNIIAQGVALQDATALKASPELINESLLWMAKQSRERMQRAKSA